MLPFTILTGMEIENFRRDDEDLIDAVSFGELPPLLVVVTVVMKNSGSWSMPWVTGNSLAKAN